MRILEAVLPGPLMDWMRSTPALYELRNDRVTRMSVGPGSGLKFVAGPSNPAYASGSNELPVQEALARHLKPGAVFYDIGANVGFFTVIGARLVGKDGAVYAFEPVRGNAVHVRLNARLNGFRNVTVLEKAVADRSGMSELWLADYSGGSALASAPPPPGVQKKLAVKVVTIDDVIFAQKLAAPAVVKVDVEGAEIEVLRGMSRTLRELRPTVIYEIDDERREPFERKRLKCESYLEGAGYRVESLPPSYQHIKWLVGHFVAAPRPL